MTLIAHLGGNRLMDIIKENAGSVRAVRVMACCTAGPCHRVIHMSFSKHRLIGPMTAQAKRRHFVPQEKFCLYRGMGVVAVETALFHRIVLELNFCNYITHFFVAAKTEFIAALQQVKLVLCRMRVMALHTVIVHHNFMGAARIFGHHRFMTGKTYFAGIGGKEFAVRGCVGVMTSGTVTDLHGGVYKGIFKLLLHVHVTIQAHLPSGPHLQVELIVL